MSEVLYVIAVFRFVLKHGPFLMIKIMAGHEFESEAESPFCTM